MSTCLVGTVTTNFELAHPNETMQRLRRVVSRPHLDRKHAGAILWRRSLIILVLQLPDARRLRRHHVAFHCRHLKVISAWWIQFTSPSSGDRSGWRAASTAAVSCCWAFRSRLFISRAIAVHRTSTSLNLVMLPFWTSFLVRTLCLDVSCCATLGWSTPSCRSLAASVPARRCLCSINDGCGDSRLWSTDICHSPCCRFTRRMERLDRTHGLKLRRIWARNPLVATLTRKSPSR